MDSQHESLPRIAFSPTEVAVATGLSLSTIQRRLAAGDLRSVKVGRRRLVPVAELERMFAFADEGCAA